MIEEKTKQKQDFFDKLLVRWTGLLCFLVPLCFCFYTYDSAQIKITLFYMGSLGAFIIWLSSLVYKGESFLNKKNFYTFLPLIIYALYIVFSYFLKPYQLVRLDSFVREGFYLALFTVVCFGFKEEDYKILLNYLFAGAWLILGYGILQIFNLDFLPWKNFFSNRVFSTLANPNFLGSFAVFMAVLAPVSFLIKPRKSLIVLFLLALINLIFTQSKGAWLSFAFSLVLACGIYVYFFAQTCKKNKNKIIALSLVILVLTGIFTFNYSIKRMQSVSFRLSTWRAAWDMVEASPLTGTGIGSFEVIYPAYKRPEIFYMENMHNTQTQHAENYFFEQWSTLGTVGFGLFLWVLFYVLKQVIFKLKILAKEERQKALLLAGFALASISIYAHNFVDVSIYFVSTGMFLVIFNGAIFNLAFGPFEKTASVFKQSNILLFKIIFVLTLLILACIGFYIQKDFWQNFFIFYDKSFLPWIYCAFFGVLFLVVFSVFVKIILKTKKVSVCLLVISVGIFYLLFWFQFMSNVYYSRATSLAEQGRFEALNFYTKAIAVNPVNPILRRFRGLLFFNRFSLVERREIPAGDKTEPSNDFMRALKDFEKTKQLYPNFALLDYSIASLYLKYADTKEPRQKAELYSKAEEHLKYALLLDPSFDNSYYQLANIELARGNQKKAVFYIKEYLTGPKEVKNPEYLKIHRDNQKANTVLKQLGGSL